MQRNWIGKSQGAKVKFAVADAPDAEPIEVFTTRIDTIYGATALILAPTHKAIERLLSWALADSIEWTRLGKMRQTSVKTEDLAAMEKEGFFTGRFAINPFSGEKIPIWVGNFVLMEYGTGAIMAVPAHDERDLEFCRKYGLPVRVVVEGKEVESSKLKVKGEKKIAGAARSGQAIIEEAVSDYGVSVDSGPYSGMESEAAIAKMAAFAEQKGFGRAETIFRLKDWGVSRQRYWGTPIPVVYCSKDGMVPVPDKDLPVLLP